jgi:RNA polymerase sigma-70 factor (ECF subfamily)
VGSRLLDVPSGATDMVPAVQMALPRNALMRNQTALALLIERATAGDTAAFEEIMIHSQQRVMTMSWRMLGNEADARDASQEVFLRVYKYLGRFRQDQDFFAWVYRITVNVCRDMSKKRRQESDRLGSFAADSSEELREIPFEHEDAEQTLIQAQHRELISRAIATLPFKERASVLLRDVEGLPTDEVARVLKSSPTTVRSQISSARRKIRDYCRRYTKVREESR